jgi:predicted nucleotide-binding protein (sugar kinase/HSP70/actin superfamily)
LNIDINDVHFVSQWAYPEQILKAAKWTAMQDSGVQFVELTSFGCGPDAFMLDEIHALLQRYGKALTQLKIDDVTNIGSLKLRVRSVIDSLKLNYCEGEQSREVLPFATTPIYTEEEHQQKQKIIIPYFTSFIAPLIPSFMRLAGYDADVLPMSNHESDDLGLRYANNEICYPATLIVGDIIKAFKNGLYNPETTTVLITQTGGQCRASNYISLIKKALVEAGYEQVPVISLSMTKNILNNQPGFKLNFKKLIPIALTTILYTDAIAKMFYAAAPREKEIGMAAKLRDKYLDIACSSVERNQSKELVHYLQIAARDFDRITLDKDCARIGIVGEIYLKFNYYAQRGITEWITNHEIEVEPPILCDFFLQTFVNQDVKRQTLVESSALPKFVLHTFYKLIKNRISQVNKACSAFRYFHPFDDIYTLAKNAEQVVSLSAQFGEGWLLPGEVATMVHHGIYHVISLQPFGCIANHIISKGIEKRLRTLYPQLNFLGLDFDSGVSDVNVTNRLLLFANDLLKQVKNE